MPPSLLPACLLLASLGPALPQVWAAQNRVSSCRAPQKCVSLLNCPSALQGLRDKRRPLHCGFAGRVPDVCCPPPQSASPPTCASRPSEPPPPSDLTCDTLAQHYADNVPPDDDPSPGRVARRMCRKHQEDLCSLPTLYPEASCPAHGARVDILEFPHMALLGYGDRDSIEYGCGGSLISPNFIMTAAHCANRQDGLSIGWALLGATNRTSAKPKKNDTHQLIEVAEVIVHPEYVSSAKYHDIALLRLAEGAVVNQDDVRPACLDTDVDKDFTGEDAIATGWGATFFAGDGSESLLKVTLKVRDLQFCRDNINLDPKPLPRGLVDSMMCAGGGADGMDTCQGDSGGPLQVRAHPRNSQTCIYRIIGVVSFGPACGLGKPAVYTRNTKRYNRSPVASVSKWGESSVLHIHIQEKQQNATHSDSHSDIGARGYQLMRNRAARRVAAYTEWIESIVWPTLPDGCARYAVGGNQGPVLIPNSGPGSVARGVCRGYHLDFCPNYWESGGPSVKPDLSRDSMCHHNHPKAGRTNRNPTTVTLGYGRSSYNSQFSCAGALVSPRAVLTAARCRALGCLPLSHVRLSHPLSCSGTLEFRVDSVRVHPEYRDGEAYADLAVALLAQSIDLRHYLPLCLDTPAHGPVRPGQRAQAAGWNIQGFWEDISYNLDNTSLTVRTPEECSSALLGYGKLRQAHPRGVLPSQLCAGGICDNETYGGDSGVPLARSEHSLRVEKQQNRQYAVDRVLGVASSLTYCTARTPEGRPLPDLFTSVASHVTWIESVVWADQ